MVDSQNHHLEAEIILLCVGVSEVCAQLLRPRRDSAGTRITCGLYHHLSLFSITTTQSWTKAADLKACNDSRKVDETYSKVRKNVEASLPSYGLARTKRVILEMFDEMQWAMELGKCIGQGWSPHLAIRGDE
jgi:hypothetical protein